jgi:phosphoglycolate phosphatase
MLAIFDVDGTLIDSRAIILEAARQSFAEHNLPVPEYEAVRQVVGLPLQEALHRLAPHLGEPELHHLVEGYKQAFRGFRLRPDFIEPQYDGVQHMLDDLRTQGWQLAMATGKSRRGVEEILDMHNWRGVFDAAFCSDDGPGKPHPHMVEQCLLATGIPCDRAVMIGDTSFDMIMARAANVRALGVTWGFHTRDEIISGGADEMYDEINSLRQSLSRRSIL